VASKFADLTVLRLGSNLCEWLVGQVREENGIALIWPKNFGYVTRVPTTVWLLTKRAVCWKLEHIMAPESTKHADSLRFEKLMLLVLAVCLVALVGVQVFRFF
jgi:hypothetical protein